MFDSNSVKVGILVLLGFLGFVFSIAGGIVANSYLENQKVDKCISADKIWAEGACVNNINELRYVDND
ncbi:hypothetical protein AXJ18_gp108 [Streptomyces phage Jay2Jay]|uniref:Uncharacterized protein n=2 Tax=Samistivirus jay2jay TaxID=2560786 RepID=A0A221SB79_9CAUD|nr:hypothetical protein AXJ18_gp108 [Streptomyces phage Jay2Jay]AIW02666.1 hypothetical protein PBI_JAY2JAY_210 [Streptomyces phage Jay2Jay]ASN73241.1 hypothetical protein SEA_WARPY_208 [Streptomyces phage Warpy]UEM46952.1 hypothetical protein SEA_TARGARYEN_204 [Streptomyces phage Targaryen]